MEIEILATLEENFEKCPPPPSLTISWIRAWTLWSAATYSMFADDTCIGVSCRNMLDNFAIINNELVKINKWMKSNSLTLNKNKSQYVIFKRRNKSIPDDNVDVCIDGALLERSLFSKYLGVYIDDHLCFDVVPAYCYWGADFVGKRPTLFQFRVSVPSSMQDFTSLVTPKNI